MGKQQPVTECAYGGQSDVKGPLPTVSQQVLLAQSSKVGDLVLKPGGTKGADPHLQLRVLSCCWTLAQCPGGPGSLGCSPAIASCATRKKSKITVWPS